MREKRTTVCVHSPGSRWRVDERNFISSISKRMGNLNLCAVQLRIWSLSFLVVFHLGAASCSSRDADDSGGHESTVVNSVGMKLNLIPAGDFMMGSKAELGRPVPENEKNEYPSHRVRISTPFYMGQTEVTRGQWKKVMVTQNQGIKVNHPVAEIRWEGAVEFCERLSMLEGRTYRLPTEAEWEYACRAGTTTEFSFVGDPRVLRNHIWTNPRFEPEVGKKKTNPWGLHDMHGNVAEWCSDFYDAKYYARSKDTDPRGPEAATTRVVRGCWDDNSPRGWRSAARGTATTAGFRIVLETKSLTPLSPDKLGQIESLISTAEKDLARIQGKWRLRDIKRGNLSKNFYSAADVKEYSVDVAWSRSEFSYKGKVFSRDKIYLNPYGSNSVIALGLPYFPRHRSSYRFNGDDQLIIYFHWHRSGSTPASSRNIEEHPNLVEITFDGEE